MDAAAPEKQAAAGTSPTETPDIKGRLVQYAFYMQKQAYAPSTIRSNTGALKALLKRNADLLNPESVKEALAKEVAWSQNRRRIIITAYGLFLKLNGLSWEKPRCNIVRKIPFIPSEQEIDMLIAGCPTTVATFLQLLKETAMRSGEAVRLSWINVDFERRIITLNESEKGSLPRIWNNPTDKLIGARVHEGQTSTSPQTLKPQTTRGPLSHTQTLASNHGIPLHRRRITRRRVSRSQRRPQHTALHTT